MIRRKQVSDRYFGVSVFSPIVDNKSSGFVACQNAVDIAKSRWSLKSANNNFAILLIDLLSGLNESLKQCEHFILDLEKLVALVEDDTVLDDFVILLVFSKPLLEKLTRTE